MAQSLEEFCEVNRKKTGPKCKTCQLPQLLRDEIKEGHDAGNPYTVIVKWLQEVKGVHDITSHALSTHFLSHGK